MRFTALLLLASASALLSCSSFEGNGITVSGKARLGLTTYAYQDLADRPPTKNLHCSPVIGSDGTIRIQAGVEETDRGTRFDIDVTFEPNGAMALTAAVTAMQAGLALTGDGCRGEVIDYDHTAAIFSARIQCPTVNGGEATSLDIDTTFNSCHLLAPR